MANTKVRVGKHNFWNDLRKQRGWSLEFIADSIKVSKGTVGNWFAGSSAPRDDNNIQALCTLFGINFDEGYNAFYHAERNWRSSRNHYLSYGPDNFWNRLRAANHESLSDVAKATGIPKATLATAFSGKYVPRDKVIRAVCEHYCISFDEARKEFSDAHIAYVANREGAALVAAPEVPAQVNAVETVATEATTENDYDFWPAQLRNNPFTMHDIAKYLNVDEKKVTDYFIGRVKPNFNQIRMLCALFGGIELIKGCKAFDALHQRYESGKVSGEVTQPGWEPTTAVPAEAVSNSSDIFEIIYRSGKLSYKEFLSFYQIVAEKKEKEALKLLYTRLDFEDYFAISKVLSDWCK